MKFMIEYRIHQGKLHEALAQFSHMDSKHDEADKGKEIKLIGRWHDLIRGRGMAICETDNPQAITHWALNWNAIMDVEIAVVLDDEETRALGRARQ